MCSVARGQLCCLCSVTSGGNQPSSDIIPWHLNASSNYLVFPFIYDFFFPFVENKFSNSFLFSK